MDDVNALSTFWYRIDKDAPGKVWWHCPLRRDAIYRAIGINPADNGACYAISPFRLYRSDTGVRVLAAYPAPRCFDEPDHHWLAIEQVISWNPLDDRAEILGDAAPQIVGHLTDEANGLFSSPRKFFQAWCQRRAQFAVQRQEARKQPWHAIPAERDEIPGGLVIGATADIHWQPSLLPQTIQCVGINPAIVNKAIMRAARLPRALGGAI